MTSRRPDFAVHHVRWIRIFEAALIAVATALLLLLGTRSIGGLAELQAWWLFAPAALAGLLSADFATGTVHWLCDRFFSERTPVLGRVLIKPFRDHHVDPDAIARHGLLELHGNSCIPVIAALGVLQLVPSNPVSPLRLGFEVWLWFFLSTSLATNQFHRWAHAKSAPSAARWLQRKGVILSPERHARHHRGNFDRSYCMTSGLLNPLLDRIDLFGRVERRIRSLQGAAH